MPDKRKDSRGRTLRNGETQQPDGRYKFRYTDGNGERRTVYSWKLVVTDKLKDRQRGQESLREKEKRIFKDLDDHIKTKNAEKVTVDDMFEKFMDIRIDLRGMTRKCYRDLFTVHVSPSIGGRPVGKVKPSDIQKLYQSAVVERGITPSTVQKVHSVVYQVFEIAVVDNLIRTNPSPTLSDILPSQMMWYQSPEKHSLLNSKRSSLTSYTPPIYTAGWETCLLCYWELASELERLLLSHGTTLTLIQAS